MGQGSRELVMGMFKEFAADESGATMIEYGLIVAILSVAIITTYLGIQDGLRGSYTKISSAINDKL
jgi:pilus assembly protein Flp/PilA